MPKTEVCAYAAGLFEGEGTITFRRLQYKGEMRTRPIVTMGNTDQEIVRFFHRHWKAQEIHSTQPNCANAKRCFYWTLNVKESITRFLDDIAPYVQTTRMKKRIALMREDLSQRLGRGRVGNPEYIAGCVERYHRMRKLNHRGKAANE